MYSSLRKALPPLLLHYKLIYAPFFTLNMYIYSVDLLKYSSCTI